jgi:hypothetical protein
MCPSGASLRADFVQNPFTGSTYEEMKAFALLFEAGSQFCKLTKADELLCCPEDKAPPPSPEPVSGGASASGLVGCLLAFILYTTFTIAL